MNTDILRAGSVNQTGASKLFHAEVSDKIIGVFYDVYNELGHGFLEAVYEQAMLVALRQAMLDVEAQVEIPVRFRGVTIGEYRADMVVDRRVMLELKAVRSSRRCMRRSC